MFSAEANYIQTATSLQVSAEANVEKLTYERQPVGDIGLGATWLPGDKDTHYLNTYFTYDNEEVMTADGILKQKNGKDTLEVSTRFEHFPLKMVNAFIPDQMVTFTGDIDGGFILAVRRTSLRCMVILLWTACRSTHVRQEHVTGLTTVRYR